jgi:hypothetical protein
MKPKYFVVVYRDRAVSSGIAENYVEIKEADEVIRNGFDFKTQEIKEWKSAFSKLGARIAWGNMQKKYIHPEKREKFPKI